MELNGISTPEISEEQEVKSAGRSLATVTYGMCLLFWGLFVVTAIVTLFAGLIGIHTQTVFIRLYTMNSYT